MGCRELDITSYYQFVSTQCTPKKSHLCMPTSSCTQKNAYSGFSHTVIPNYRYYSAELGRWLSRDLIGEEGGVNLYCTVKNDPINLWDYLGSRPMSEGDKFVAKFFVKPFVYLETLIIGDPNKWFEPQKSEDEVTKVKDELNAGTISCAKYCRNRSQVNDNKYGHSNQMSEFQKIYGLLGTHFITIAGFFYEIGTALAVIEGHIQGEGLIGIGKGDFFDGQHPVNWLYDTPGDIIGNTIGQINGILDMLSDGFLDSGTLNKSTLLIPGPDYHKASSKADFKKLAKPGMSNPFKK